MAPNRLVIGLDFGTTFSAIAYGDSKQTSNKAEAAVLFTEWPGTAGAGHDSSKVPSRILYGLQPDDNLAWGYEIKPSSKGTVHALMKLKLDEGQRRSRPLSLLLTHMTGRPQVLEPDGLGHGEAPPEYPGKLPVEIATDYLAQIRQCFYKWFQEKTGESLLSTLSKQLIVTVPAVWTEAAKDLTLKAVMNAGFEAATIAMIT